MRIATWNVNSIRTRVEVVIDFLNEADVDVLAMQETKCRNDQFPLEKFEAAGYDVAHFGLNQWNGVGIASRLPISEVEEGFPNMPRFSKDQEESGSIEARAIFATVHGIRLCSVYVPNGRGLDDPHFDYKLRWLRELGDYCRKYQAREEARPLALAGDFNVAPLDQDVGDPWFKNPGSTHTSPAEREALFKLLEMTRMEDPVRSREPEGYTFWDYKQGKFEKNEGMRIDFIFTTNDLSLCVSNAYIASERRSGDRPSDHVPVVVDLDMGDGFDTPMVF